MYINNQYSFDDDGRIGDKNIIENNQKFVLLPC